MKVFISWSGETSKAIASLLRKYLPIMLQQVRPFMSRHDIITGSRWSERIQEELEEASFGIIVLTPSNLSAKWLLFEAGAISKLRNSGTACLLCAGLDDTAVAGPLQQFQFQRFEKESFFKLVRDMNQRTTAPLLDEAMGMILEKWWPDIEKDYNLSVKKFHDQEQEDKNPRDEREFQDEILKTLRSLVNSSNNMTTTKPDIRFGFPAEVTLFGDFEDPEIVTTKVRFPKDKHHLVLECLSKFDVDVEFRKVSDGIIYTVNGRKGLVQSAFQALKILR